MSRPRLPALYFQTAYPCTTNFVAGSSVMGGAAPAPQLPAANRSRECSAWGCVWALELGKDCD